MKKHITIIILSFFWCDSFSQKKSEGLKAYDLGVIYFNQEKLKEADSLFEISAKLEPNADVFYNKAMVNKKLGNFTDYCYNLSYAIHYGDRESYKLFSCDCIKVDSFYVTESYKKADSDKYFYKLRFIKASFNLTQEFYKYDNKNQLLLSYEIDKNNDTSYTHFSKNIWDSLIINQIYNPSYFFIQKNIKYPEAEKEAQIQGKVFIQFYINKNGKIEGPKVIKIPAGGINLATEALRVIKILPNYKPVMFNGNNVKMKVIMPFIFRLQ